MSNWGLRSITKNTHLKLYKMCVWGGGEAATKVPDTLISLSKQELGGTAGEFKEARAVQVALQSEKMK